MSDKGSRVNVHSTLTAVSSRPVAAVKNHPFSGLDLAMGRHTLHIIFYYEKTSFRSFDTDPVRESLSEALSLYPPVTGRLTRGESGNWEVKCHDAGVRVSRARVDAPVDEWLRSADGNEERDLTVWEDMPESPDTWSPFRVQINDFEGGGVAIGMSCTHMHADATCLTLLLKTWTEVHRHQPISYPPSFQPAAPPPGWLFPVTQTKSADYLTNKSQAQAQAHAQATSVKMALATFKFSDSIIKQCLSEINDKCPHATPFDFLAALFWTRIARLKKLKDDKHDRTHTLSVSVDFRKLLQEPLPYGYFGNALHFSLLSVNKEEMEFGRLGHTAELVHRHVSGLKDEEFWSAMRLLESQKGEDGKYALPRTIYGPELTCISMEHMIVEHQSIMYSTIFDSMKPVHVSCHVGNVQGEGLIMVMPSAEEGLARVVTVTLPEEEIVNLCKDQAILCLEPKLLLACK